MPLLPPLPDLSAATAVRRPRRRSRVVPGTFLLAAGLALGACSAGASPAATDVTGVTVRDTGATVPVAVDSPPGTAALPTPAAERPTTSLPRPDQTRNVQVTRDGVVVHEAPSSTSAAVVTLRAKTTLGSRTTLLVTAEADGWFQVALPIRPNGSTGWIPAEDVKVRDNASAVAIDVSDRSLTVTTDGAVTVQARIAVGADDTPTPTGHFYVTDLVQNVDPGGAYGPFALGLSGHSETLTEFAGGDGQIGVHGTNDPSSIGRNVSHGCVRLPNDVIARLADELALGTPVTITA